MPDQVDQFIFGSGRDAFGFVTGLGLVLLEMAVIIAVRILVVLASKLAAILTSTRFRLLMHFPHLDPRRPERPRQFSLQSLRV